MKLETVFDLNISALRAWSIIADMKNYHIWHPNYRFNANPHTGAIVGFSSEIRRKAARSSVTVTECEKPRTLSWVSGSPLFLRWSETYSVTAAAHRASIRHIVECSGVIPLVLRHVLANRFLASMRRQDLALQTFTKRKVRSNSLRGRRTLSSAHENTLNPGSP